MAHPRHDGRPAPPAWIPLSVSFSFLVRQRTLLGWSALLVLITVIFTWIGFLLTTGFMDSLTAPFFAAAPEHQSVWGWVKYGGWLAAKYLFLLISRIVAFFLAFLIAYTLTTPFYSFLSTAAEKIYCGADFHDDEGLTLGTIVKDIVEGGKIALFGIVITMLALPLSFIPLIGQIAVFIVYTYYSALMFIDYPTSRRRWRLGRKLSWLDRYRSHSFRLGVLPAAITMIPILNMFLMALLFPLLTVHATLNFVIAEQSAAPRQPRTVSP